MKNIILSILLLSGLASMGSVKVIGIGRSVNNGTTYKQQALAEAMRDAIRKGAGVNLITKAQTTNYVLDYDYIYSQAFGYIKNYKIRRTYTDNGGFYTVEITATVDKGQPEMNDYLAIRQIIALKGAPRILICCTGTISGTENAGAMVARMLREIAIDCGFQTVTVAQTERSNMKHPANGKSSDATFSTVLKNGEYDIIINVVIDGSYQGYKKIYGVSMQAFSFSADMEAVYSNGNTIAQIAMASRELFIRLVSGEKHAARAALMRFLAGNKDKNFRALLMRIITTWIAEFDSGMKITVKLDNIDHGDFEKLINDLRSSEGINAVYIRKYAEGGSSTIEVASRLDAYALAKLIIHISKENLKISQQAYNYIFLKNTTMFNQRSLIIGIGIVLLIISGLVFIAVRKKQT